MFSFRLSNVRQRESHLIGPQFRGSNSLTGSERVEVQGEVRFSSKESLPAESRFIDSVCPIG